MRIDARTRLRIARPCADLAASERFWTEGLGADVLWRTDPGELRDGEHALVMVGWPGAAWHLELVDDPPAASASAPSAEDLLVLYTGTVLDASTAERIVAAGGERVASRNPYWDRWGVTFRDPDGYHLVLSHRTWDAD
jgi:catechol 2,3-dioxygenase-like lactoylglutathione lyase family enzyme